MPITLTAIERALFDKLLAGEHAFLSVLRDQYRSAAPASRDLTGVGFFLHLSVPADVPRAEPPNFELGDVYIDLEGVPAGAEAILFIRDGVIDFLEGYTHEGTWPPVAENFALHYHEEPRDLEALDSQVKVRAERSRRST